MESARNSILMTCITQIWAVLLVGCAAWEICTIQIRVATRHQYGISVVAPQTSFRAETRKPVVASRNVD